MSQLDKSKDIIVDTFLDEDSKGIAPRALYLSLGFEPAELLDNFGYPHQRFVLRSINETGTLSNQKIDTYNITGKSVSEVADYVTYWVSLKSKPLDKIDYKN